MECKYENTIRRMYNKVEHIDENVRKLISWKSFITGGILVLAFIAPLIVTIIFK